MMKEDAHVRYVPYCADCIHYSGESEDDYCKILCKSLEKAEDWDRLPELGEEDNFELTPPSRWGIICEQYAKKLYI